MKKFKKTVLAITVSMLFVTCLWFLPVEASFTLRKQVAKALFDHGYISYARTVYQGLQDDGDTTGSNNLAVLILAMSPDSSKQERRFANQLFELAAENGSGVAAYNLTTQRIGFARNVKGILKVREGLERARGLGDQWSSEMLALGNDPKQWIWKIAADGDANAAYSYAELQRLDGNEDEQIKGLRMAAEAGRIKAMTQLGRLLSRNPLVPPQSMKNDAIQAPAFSESEQWYRKAADAGDITAAYRLGVCYREGYDECRMRDVEEARKFFTQAIANKKSAGEWIYPPGMKMEPNGELRIGYPKLILTPMYSHAKNAAEALENLPVLQQAKVKPYQLSQ